MEEKKRRLEHLQARIREQAEAMCRKLLANPVTEDFQVEVRPA